MTSTQLTLGIPNWQKLEGTTLEGGYELQKVTEAGPESATIRVRVLGDSRRKVSARFYNIQGTAAEEQVTIWESLRALRNAPALNLPLGAGTVAMDDFTLAYIVLSDPDETLADGLTERVLTAAEAKEVIQSVAGGLSVLHASGFVHGRVESEEIVAAGNSILLTTEFVRPANGKPLLEKAPPRYLAPESNGHNTTAAADVWCAGATLFESLTRRAYRPELLDEAIRLDAPFGAFEAQCLEPNPESRCKAEGLVALLSNKNPAPTLSRDVPPRPVVSSAASVPEPLLPDDVEVLPVPEPKRTARPATPVYAYDRREPVEDRPSRRSWLYLVVGALVVIALFWFGKARTRPKLNPQPIQAPSNAPAPANSPTTAIPPAPPVSSPKSESNSAPARPTPHPHPSKASIPAVAPANGSIWRVILFTYNRESDATKRAELINRKHRDVRAEVFSPNGRGGPYLVVAGSGMTYDQARAKLQKIIRSGMPHDSYIQNYRQ